MAMKFTARLFTTARDKYNNLKIGTKIMVFYFLLLIFSMVVSSLLYQWVNTQIMSKKVSEISVQTLRSVRTNVNLLIDTVNNYSKMVTANNNVQSVLRNPDSKDPKEQQLINQYLIEITESTPLIDSIYIFDNMGRKYAADKTGVKIPQYHQIEHVSWYPEVQAKKGGYILILNGGELFPYEVRTNFISMIRVINDLDTQHPIGIMVINIPPKAVIQTYQGLTTQYDTRIILKDEHTQDIIKSHSSVSSVQADTYNYYHQTQVILKDARSQFYIKTPFNPDYVLPDSFNYLADPEYNSMTCNIGDSTFLFSYLKIEEYGWTVISIIPFNELTKESWIYSFITFLFILINSCLVFLGLIIISRFITNPINKLLKSMKGVEKGEFLPVNIRTGNDEIGKLKEGYNLMIQEIQQLVAKIIEEQKIKRKAELNALQAQIKPHFLYNTFDAISFLALKGRSNDVYQIIKALGSYYRLSLSKGRDIITLAEEIDIVKNYLTIQKIRYQDMFTAVYFVDERVHPVQIPKLILQPFVENALYHGIKPSGAPGEIKISAEYCREKNRVEICISDNGVGMNETVISGILCCHPRDDSAGFGIWGTMERLRIFYGTPNVLSITSRPGQGTQILIIIPLKGSLSHEQ